MRHIRHPFLLLHTTLERIELPAQHAAPLETSRDKSGAQSSSRSTSRGATRCLIGLLLACVATASLSAKRETPAPAPTPTSGVTLAPSSWNVRYSAGMPAHPSPLAGMVGWYLDFPNASGSVNYLTTAYTMPMTQTQSVTFTAQVVTTSGTPVFNFMLEPWNTCTTPAHVRAYIEQFFSNKYDATYAPANYRWWANPTAMMLSPGVATVTMPLSPDQWTDAEGARGSDQLAGFTAALGHPAAIGMTFGGGCFFGHGVNVLDGTARFILSNYAVQ